MLSIGNGFIGIISWLCLLHNGITNNCTKYFLYAFLYYNNDNYHYIKDCYVAA